MPASCTFLSVRFSFPIFALTCVATLVSLPAAAQNTPVLSVSGGYAAVHEGELQMPGFYVEVERRLTRLFSAVGQVHRATGSGEGYFSTIDWTDLFAGGGVRVSGRPAPWFEPYGQVLVGSYRVKTVEIARPRTPGTSDTYTDQIIATLVGGGATFMPNPYVGFRVGADLQFYPESLPNARVVLGLVVPIGRR